MSTTITGGIKFFNTSVCKFSDGALAMASSGDASANYAIDRNIDTKWRSVSSNDTISETIEIDFNGTQTFTRLLLLNMNFKDFSVKYDVSGAWTDFTNTFGIDGATSGGKVVETAFADDSAYYEFDSVTTAKIQVTVTKTQTVNAEKFLTQLIACTEIGTLQGHPAIKPTVDKNERVKTALSGRMMVIKSIETFQAQITFKNYPGRSPYNADLDIAFSLFDLDDNFNIWLCGGRRGSYFSYQSRPFRLRDVYECQVIKNLTPTYSNEIFTTQLNFVLNIAEAI